MASPVQITVTPDGPLKISGARSARFCSESIATDGDLYLCRCGETDNAPYCDGSHKRVGFQGTSDSPPTAEIRVWEGTRLRTHFNAAACMHAGHCAPMSELRERESGGDARAAVEIMSVVQACPSGALTYELKADLEEPTQMMGASLDIMQGGEIRVQAEFEINVALQEHQPSNAAALCRCGSSKNKPWCDGRHRGKRNFR